MSKDVLSNLKPTAWRVMNSLSGLRSFAAYPCRFQSSGSAASPMRLNEQFENVKSRSGQSSLPIMSGSSSPVAWTFEKRMPRIASTFVPTSFGAIDTRTGLA